MLQTYQTKIKNVQLNDQLTSDMYFEDYGKFFGVLERKLFVQSHIKGVAPASLKKTFSKKHGITSRQFNSIRMQLDGKVSSLKEKRKVDIEDVKNKIKFVQLFIEKKEKQKGKQFEKILTIKRSDSEYEKRLKKYKHTKFVLHQKKRRLRNLQQKLNRLKTDEETNTLRICFGSKKVFHKQFHLSENQYRTHKEWKVDWNKARSAQFIVIGSKDETFGNQTATYDLENNLRLRVADAFIPKYGKYVNLPQIHFPYGQQQLDRAKIMYIGVTRGGKPQKYFRSITYRFLKKNKGWYLNATVDIDTPKVNTSKDNGLIGIDLNAGFSFYM